MRKVNIEKPALPQKETPVATYHLFGHLPRRIKRYSRWLERRTSPTTQRIAEEIRE
jgi:hypothetical protein